MIDVAGVPAVIALGHQIGDVDLLGHPEPRGAVVVAAVARQVELLLEDPAPTARVDDEAAVERVLLSLRSDEHHMARIGPLGGDLRAEHRVALEEGHAGGLGHAAQIILEATPIELKAGHDGLLARADLAPHRERSLGVAHEVAEAEFRELPLVEVLPQTQHALEPVRADLHRGLAHLEGGVGERPLGRLHHGHAQLRKLVSEMKRAGEAREASAHDDHVEALHDPAEYARLCSALNLYKPSATVDLRSHKGT